MRHLSVLGVTLAVLGGGAGAPAAHASVIALPAANGFVQCNTTGGQLVVDDFSCSGPSDYGTLSYSPFASLQTYAFGEGLVDSAGAFGVLNYSLEVIGGTPGDVVPLDVAAILEANPISIGYVFSELGVAADGSVTETICSSFCGAGTGVTSFNGVLQVNAVSGTVYTNAVHLEVEAGGALGDASQFDGGFASADPHIYVDPSDPNAADYTVILSASVGNGVPTVPEPGTWGLMLLGAGVMGASLRVRRWRAV